MSSGARSATHPATRLSASTVPSVRYSFFVHRTAPRWRLVIAELDCELRSAAAEVLEVKDSGRQP